MNLENFMLKFQTLAEKTVGG